MDPQPSNDQDSAKDHAVNADSPLPELKPTLLLKSQEPVTIKDEKDGLVIPYGENTVVIGAGIDEIQILDKSGKKIEGLDITQTMIFDWDSISNIRNGRFSTLVQTHDLNNPSDRFLGVNDFPLHLQAFATSFIKRGGTRRVGIPARSWKLDVMKSGKMDERTDDGYILIYQKDTKQFIAFQTKTDAGVDLPPRNWKRFDSVDVFMDELPENIKSELKELNNDAVNYKRISTDHDVLVYDDRVVVAKLGQSAEVPPDFVDKIIGVGTNIVSDPRDTQTIYYCKTTNPESIFRLDTNGDPASWHTEAVDLPQQYTEITNLQIDPSGHFFTFESNEEFVILSRDDLTEVAKIPNVLHGKLDQHGRVYGINDEGCMVIYDPNFQDVALELEKRRIARLSQGLRSDLFVSESATTPVESADQFQHLEAVRADLEGTFQAQLQTITRLEDMATVTDGLSRLRTRLQKEGLQPAQISFITGGIQDSIRDAEHVLAAPVVAQSLADLDTKLSGTLTITTLAEARDDLAKLRSMDNLVDDATRAQIRALENQLGQQSTELFRTEGEVITRDVGEMVGGVRAELDAIVSMPDFADWQEFRLPQLISRLGALANDCPLEAHETQRSILAARRQLQELSKEYETRFKENYAKVREHASEIIDERAGLIRIDMHSAIDRLRGRGFGDRAQFEAYTGSSEALGLLRTEIEELARQDPDAARELDKELKIGIARLMSEVERGGLTTIAETGQQMILFRDTLFPRWEGKVHEKVQRHVDLIFMPDERTKGPGVRADQIFGDVGIMEINSRGHLEKRRIYQGMQNEDEWRYGSVRTKGADVFPTYVSQADYRRIKQSYADWNRGDASTIRRTLHDTRQELRDLYKERQLVGSREAAVDEAWRERYRVLMDSYAQYAVDNHVSILSRIDRLRNAPETKFTNGAGYVPEWQNHWTTDETTEQYLDEMAQVAKMQLDLQEGLLNLKGHAGTGKDILVKMFCNRSNRQYFPIDCSKWTTEFELSEDVVLEAQDGASRTVKVPSIVLNAITTPGAVMYFNEFNAMPEQAQIFLHGLMDEKRTLTLKTSSGKAVRALSSVLLMGSMNPGYPGTFNPQFATKSRMVGLEIDYPPLYRESNSDDPNPNPPINSAEALRIARQVDSLSDFTFDPNPEHNEFVQIWDRHINGIQNGATDLTTEQKFDLEAILTMVEFAHKLREGFILKFDKAKASAIPRGTLLIDQPITGRELRRMAEVLSKMSAEEKATSSPEGVVRDLIEQIFLPNIDKRDEKDEIKTAMATWTSTKRPAA
ncbi:hypothetical protein A3D80_01860 [Candidatus Roizmanbacteria bacterium RIFCSPHIGHO2_02_FULL_40_13b]|uniref:ATPase dynein-related AAA domain-containing protein n=1 Tax=Candidatus Roizmanbacteria bacterium RIFCSPHIGHO2_01_FULL_39_24 TaxID=1802032 RepID=A0A1F7GLW5_9BACT|nr:MAG: hypothetical protein A2799_01600 [Candidatus Roizmanbacteria bacterium RIFCSPHIGHO2_01_FULL_39_24]OGK27835.1 MAG: hypothetical protein A3D80_01860 [Candidatus Roizmanbacteria bacterium RIFCSPHIGHO2_02_FULL_40_13b]OGK49977.1 MAG: hypothetical protein A3A56_03020 [Candidatus Roizmanbacteria bacterium RIFCSPLOWO2_01_FULL_40_32]OGK55982.1 MAG: hypothetical protein A3H83_02815 [Candidatus Roizmanbacteria bacterium RIFCSPLOWO2_02_FULL_39_8]